jgi:hypothetical protein
MPTRTRLFPRTRASCYEKKIGEELVRGQEEGRLLKAHQRRPWESSGADAHQNSAATIAELGLTKQQNRDFKDMAAVPAEIIHQAVEAANAEGKVVTAPPRARARAATRGTDMHHAPPASLYARGRELLPVTSVIGGGKLMSLYARGRELLRSCPTWGTVAATVSPRARARAATPGHQPPNFPPWELSPRVRAGVSCYRRLTPPPPCAAHHPLSG